MAGLSLCSLPDELLVLALAALPPHDRHDLWLVMEQEHRHALRY